MWNENDFSVWTEQYGGMCEGTYSNCTLTYSSINVGPYGTKHCIIFYVLYECIDDTVRNIKSIHIWNIFFETQYTLQCGLFIGQYETLYYALNGLEVKYT